MSNTVDSKRAHSFYKYKKVIITREIPLVACPLWNSSTVILLHALLSVNPHQLCFDWSKVWTAGVPAIITESHATTVKHTCYKHNNKQTKHKCSNWMIRRSAWICLCFVNMECFIMKIYQMLCCCFHVWLPVFSVLNTTELMRRATSSGRKRDLAYLHRKGLDCQSCWVDMQCKKSVEVHT